MAFVLRFFNVASFDAGFSAFNPSSSSSAMVSSTSTAVVGAGRPRLLVVFEAGLTGFSTSTSGLGGLSVDLPDSSTVVVRALRVKPVPDVNFAIRPVLLGTVVVVEVAFLTPLGGPTRITSTGDSWVVSASISTSVDSVLDLGFLVRVFGAAGASVDSSLVGSTEAGRVRVVRAAVVRAAFVVAVVSRAMREVAFVGTGPVSTSVLVVAMF